MTDLAEREKVPDDVLVDDDELLEEVEYRSISWLAILTVLLAVMSSFTVLSPRLWFLALIPAVLAGIALRVLASRPEKMGRRAVLFAMAFSLFIAAIGPAQYHSRRLLLCHQARPYADQWLALVCDSKLHMAHQLHIPRPDRIEPGQDYEEYLDQLPVIGADYETLFSKPAVQTLIDHRKDAVVQFVRVNSYVRKTSVDIVRLQYTVRYEEDEQEKSVPLEMEMVRDAHEFNGVHDWYVGEAI